MRSSRPSEVIPFKSANAKGEITDRFAEGGGEMAALMRSYNWNFHPLGPVSVWPQSLRTALSICLESRFPILIWWGADLFMLYNDAYRTILGSKKHPAAMGQAGAECWPEIWDVIGPMLEGVLRRGEATWSEDQLLLLDRNGYVEECYFTFSYSPIRDESGEVGGIFTAVTETTEKILGARRLTALQELGAAQAESTGTAEACRHAAAVLSRYSLDIPFGLVYLLEGDGPSATLAASIHLDPGSDVAPQHIRLQAGEHSPWPLHEVLLKGEPLMMSSLPAPLENLPGGPWPERARSAVLLPIASAGENQATGVLIAGISPRRDFDEKYQAFFGLIARHLAAAVADARAYEDQQKRVEALAELDRAKTAFFSNVSHEFRTPLTLILGPLEDTLAAPSERLDAVSREQLTVVHRNALRLLKLVNSLLDFSRIEAGRVEAIYQPTDICSYTAELASTFRSAMERAGLQFHVQCPRGLEPIYIDRDMWEKIVLNLLSNAFKFTFAGSVSVSMESIDNSMRLQVSDTGIGISQDELPHLFERFHRVEGARGRTHEGTGIGLALVQELVKFHHGTITVASKEGSGTTFSVTIPKGKDHLPPDRVGAARTLASSAIRADSYVEEALRWLPESIVDNLPRDIQKLHQLASATPEPSELDAGGELIVLADDNADMRDYLRRLLSQRYRVHAVPNGEEAVRAARELHADLVLTDVIMPGLDGFGVLRTLKTDRETQAMPVILLSARAGEESRVEGLYAGADDYLVKPFTARELLARVGAHLRLARVRAEAAEKERILRAEADLERRRFRESFILAPAGMALLNGPDFLFTFVNAAYLRLVGLESPNQIVGKTVKEAFPEIEEQGFFQLLNQVYQTGEPFLATDRELRLRRNGEENTIYVTFSYQAVRNVEGEVEGILAHTVDVSEQVMARNLLEARVKERTGELQEAEQKLRALSGRLLQAQDEERRRLARDLHDSAGQILVALKMNLFALQQQLKTNNPELDKVAISSVELVDDLSKQLRTMSHLLHPPLLDEAGLASALRWYIEGFGERSGIRVELDLDPKLPRLPQETETAIFRIVQESLTNIHRHSGSQSATIRLEYTPSKVTVEIRDAGRGIAQFDSKKKMPARVGVGVQGMQERVRQLQGTFDIRSGETGTAVVVTFPTR
ncbi:MAG: ATP-binding protein [Candidatus Sulfotelmatobacter sp.]